jgi:hypothetical protein
VNDGHLWDMHVDLRILFASDPLPDPLPTPIIPEPTPFPPPPSPPTPEPMGPLPPVTYVDGTSVYRTSSIRTPQHEL